MVRYWVIAPYRSKYADAFNRAWEYDLENGTIAVGWTDFGDISKLEYDQLWKKIAETYPGRTERSYTIDCNTLWRFYHEIEVGDKIIARQGRKRLIGVGTVTQTAYYDEEKGKARVGELTDYYYPNLIGVDWEKKEIEYDGLAFAMNTLTGPFDDEYYKDLLEGEVHEPEQVVESGSFPIEQHLQEYIVRNFNTVFSDCYTIYEDPDGIRGEKYPITDDTGRRIGEIDILAKEVDTDTFLVIELKRDVGSYNVIGQILWYMGWVKTNLCEKEEEVRGLVICTEKDAKLDYALEMIPSLVGVRLYSFEFHLD